MAGIRFEEVTKTYGDVTALDHFSLEIPDREFLVLVGPSGCGKSTFLRLLAGLEEVTAGRITIGDRLVNDVPPKDRDLSMVFQSYALYPHMSVFDNLAFGLKVRKVDREEIRRRVAEAARMLDIEELLHRRPRQLSGGQRQRVALGRAVVREPVAFLLDEPLSNLDARLRIRTRVELINLHRRLGTTFVYVTHDQVEAMTMAGRIAVMDRGVLQQAGTPRQLYDRPDNLFVAGFIGSPPMNLVKAAVEGEGEDLRLNARGFTLEVPRGRRESLLPFRGKEVVFGLRPEDIHLPGSPPPGREVSAVRAVVEVVEYTGSELHLFLAWGDVKMLARVGSAADREPQGRIEVQFDLRRMHLFDPLSGLVV